MQVAPHRFIEPANSHKDQHRIKYIEDVQIDMVFNIVAAAVVHVAGAAGAYFWPAAAAAVAGAAMMSAPGFLISRALFEANPKALL